MTRLEDELRMVLQSGINDSNADRCYYCGLTADSIDHVIPQSVISQLADDPEALKALIGRRRQLTVLACRECNSLARATTQENLQERRAFVHAAIEHKYRKTLETPDWSDSELMELSAALRSRVMVAIASRDIIRRRLRWPGP